MQIGIKLPCFEVKVAASCLGGMADNEHDKGADEGHAMNQIDAATEFFDKTAKRLAAIGWDVPDLVEMMLPHFTIMVDAVLSQAEAWTGPSTTRHEPPPEGGGL